MGKQEPEEIKKHISVGLLAHVDAGKTTLAEGILYLSGSIRKMGRVDHQDAFLDNYELERSRGITIFSKQAELMLQDLPVTLLDTPGHVDFSAEMERTLQVLDYAVLLISGADGVQGHVETLWRLLARYQIPVFLFVNKMDQAGTDREAILKEITSRLDSRCIAFDGDMQDEDFLENLAMCDEAVLEKYLESGQITTQDIRQLIYERKVFPCYFGSALKMQGVQELLDAIAAYSVTKQYPETFGARVYKITRDPQGNRLTHLKITGGSLKVKELLSNRKWDEKQAGAAKSDAEEGIWEEKVNQIRIYSGNGFQSVPEASAGMICAVTGLEHTFAGEGLGCETETEIPVLEPVLSYRIELPPEIDVHQAFVKLRMLEEEEPQLHIVWDERLSEIHVQLMGEVQIEVLKNIVKERFGFLIAFGTGNIVYKETIQNTVEGMGHFEPLRHYAEVHLVLEPGERGSGMQFFTACSEDMLDKNWQRLILTHLEEKKHCGVLTGAEITDMRVILIAGRAHIKHTEGGDFRQATYRAIRHGLRCARSVLLEPVYAFRLEIPSETVGRALSDIQRMNGSFDAPETEGDMTVITGSAPVVTMRGYQTELIAYTKGRGRMTCTLKGYEECHNQQEVIEACGYDPEADLENPTGSVFCAHGAGFVVNWDQVQDYMQVETGWTPEKWETLKGGSSSQASQQEREEESKRTDDASVRESSLNWKNDQNTSTGSGKTEYPSRKTSNIYADEKELEEIFLRTYGSTQNKERKHFLRKHVSDTPYTWRPSKKENLEECLLVDGYNIIFAWDELKELAKVNLDGARGRLLDILSNYQGYRKNKLIVVFDAYKVPGGRGSVQKYHNIYEVYTKEAETADQYIEKTVREIGKKYRVTVATSDALEQVIILGAGAVRMSAANLWEEVQLVSRELRTNYLDQQPKGTKNYLLDYLPEQ